MRSAVESVEHARQSGFVGLGTYRPGRQPFSPFLNAKEYAAKRERFPPSLHHKYVKPRARKRCLGALVTNYVLRSWACGVRTLLQLWRACDPAAPLSLDDSP